MGNAIEVLRNVAGVMFWSLTDLFLGVCWFYLIASLVWAIIKGFRKDD